jgi:hypothetical protein
MDFEKFEIPKIETVPGSEKGSTFVIIAKNKGYKMGIRLFLAPFKVKDSAWIVIAFRLRVQCTDINVNADTARENFGDFPFYESKNHSSAVGVIPLVALPCSPAEVFNHYTTFNGGVEKNILEQIKEKFGKTGATLCIDEEVILETLRETVKDIIPEVTATVNDTPMAIWIGVNEKKP